MCTSHFGSLNVGVSVRLQFAIARSVYSSGKPDSGISRGFQPLDVFFCVWRITHDEQELVGYNVLERANHEMRVVLGLQTAHEQEIFARPHSELIENGSALGPFAFSAI